MSDSWPRGWVRNPLVSGPLVDHLTTVVQKKISSSRGGSSPGGTPGTVTTAGTDVDGKIFTIDVAVYDVDSYDDPARIYYTE